MIWRIKWENILLMTLMVCMITCWIAFIKVSNVYTLAIAVISTFMTLIVAIASETLKDIRQQIIKIQ